MWRDGLAKALAQSEDPLARIEDAVNFLVKTSDKHSDVTHLFYREGGHLSDHGQGSGQGDRAPDARACCWNPSTTPSPPGCSGPRPTRLLLAISLILLCHGYVLKGYLLRKDHSPAAYAAAVVDTAIRAGPLRPGARPGSAAGADSAGPRVIE